MTGRAAAARTLIMCTMLAGCGERVIFAQRDGTLPQTAEECRAAFDAARARTRQVGAFPRTSAEALGARIGRSIARGSIESAYTSCLTRVGAASEAGRVGDHRAVEPSVAPVGAYCGPGSAVLQGGSGYCIGS